MSEHLDREARQAALDTTRSFLAQAPAGSGKTGLLIQRFLALLAQAERPEQIVAITFTRKAASEMLARILDALNSAYAPPHADEHKRQTQELARRARQRDEERGWALLASPARLRVETIDALCAEIASSSPVTAAESIGRIEEEAVARYAEAAQRTIHELASSSQVISDSLKRLLLHVNGELQTLRNLIAQMLAARDQWTRYLPGDRDHHGLRAELDRALRNVNRRALIELRDAVPAKCATAILQMASFAAGNQPNIENLAAFQRLLAFPAPHIEALPQWRALRDLLLTKNGEWRKTVNVNTGFPPECRTQKLAMEQLLAALTGEESFCSALRALDRLPPLEFDESQWQIARALFVVLPVAVRHLKLVFAEHRVSDFPQVCEAARKVLNSHAPEHDNGIRHLLVDEYQDTSVTQQELIELLVRSWRPGDGHTMFLVGDPMQSIYGFRQAEVGLFLQVRRRARIADVPIVPLQLRRNFRSGADLVRWINSGFERIFPEKENSDTGAVTYARMDEARTWPAGVTVYPFFKTADSSAADDEEAERVVDIVLQHRMREPKATIAILVSARTHLKLIAPKLAERGVHFRAVEIESLAEQQVVRDLQALTRALLHPADRIAWLAVLRAPWCGLELCDLDVLCGAAETKHACVPQLIEQNAARLPAEARERVGRAMAVLDTSQAERGRVPLAKLVEGAWLALGGPVCVAPERLEDAATYFRALAEAELGGDIADWGRFELRLKKLFAAPDPRADGRLQLMTIHKAKGLEFDVVIIPQLGRPPGKDDKALLLWREFAGEDHPELLLAPVEPKGSESDPLYKYLERVQSQRRKEESRRLLYVAATRARRALHLLGCVGLEKNGELGEPDQRTLLAQLWPVVRADFAKALAGRIPRQPTLFAIAASREVVPARRLPLDWQLPAPPAAVPVRPSLLRAESANDAITFDWAGELRRRIGTVIHAWLHRIAKEGVAHWNARRLNSERPTTVALLRSVGVAEEEMSGAVTEVERALAVTLESSRGRWCLQQHQGAECELALSGVVSGKFHHVRVDRTFVCDGVRWIIDYKSGTREGSGLEAFLDAELARYGPQIEIYSELVSQLDQRPVRAALYFPANGGWREWKPLTKAATQPEA